MEQFSIMASSLVNCLDFTWDIPSNHSNGMMPVLDTQMWVGEQARSKGILDTISPESNKITRLGNLKKVILFGFFKKPMANKCSNLQRSGIPESMKVNTAVQETLRRLKNTSRELRQTEMETTLKDYMGELAMGGYTHPWRFRKLEESHPVWIF